MGRVEYTLICDNCKQTFMCNDWRATKTINAKDRGVRKNIFCSRKCSGEFATKNNPNYIPCEVCGKLAYLKKSQQNKVKHHCCSYECSYQIRKEVYSGEGNHQYGLRGSKNSSWIDKEHISTWGYIVVEDVEHPFRNYGNKRFEHRVIAEKYLLTEENSVIIDGISYLSPKFDVHHKDGNKKNNSVDNLQVMTRSDHMKLHAKKRFSKIGSTGV